MDVRTWWALRALGVSAALLVFGCDPTVERRDGEVDGDAGTSRVPDEDGDGISDADEGRSEDRDTDGDGTPDYLDDDSDGDGIPDADEAGDADPATPPIDTDEDGTPDFVDLDADGNGIPDAQEGTGDPDGDGLPDYRDLDDDGDFVADRDEIGGDPALPADCDGDGTPDFRQPDSDGDTIRDDQERLGGSAVDTDEDGTPDFCDPDSDEDGIPDAMEAGDADVNTPPRDSDMDGTPDFRDPDSDNDGLSDADEVAAGTDPFDRDSDDDGISDLVETASGTDPLDPADNPRANGDFVFVVPYMQPPDPTEDDLAFSTDLRSVDVYVVVDRSGSMTSEINSIRNNIQTVLDNLTCPPLGSGDPADCIEDLWAGIGSIGYAGGGGRSYRNNLDVQSDPTMVGPALPTDEPSGCCAEPLYLGVWAAATGMGNGAESCGVSDGFGPRDCAGSPADMAGLGGVGYPCFRSGALPVVMLVTDEPPSTVYTCPGEATTLAALNGIGAKFIGVTGSVVGSQATLDRDLGALATGTGAVDTAGDPLVFPGNDAAAASAIESGIRTLANAVRVDISAVPVDDPSDSVDAVDAFVDRLETLQLGTAECTDGLTDEDTDGDGFPDVFRSVLFGTPVCWRVIPQSNTTVMPTREPQLFRATIQVFGDGVTLLDERDVFFLVPPEVTVVGPD